MRRGVMCRWLDRLESLLCCDEIPRVVFRIGVALSSPVNTPKTPQFRRWPLLGEILMATEITVDQKVNVEASIVDRRGNPARVDGVPEWATDNSDVVALTPSSDGLSCEVRAVGMVGTANVQMTADADTGGGVKPLIGTLALNVTAGNATTVELRPGTPQEQE